MKKMSEKITGANSFGLVDLDLPSGLLWCDKNVGAVSSEDPGDYFAFGETKTKERYSPRTYLCDEPEVGTDKDPFKDRLNISGTDYDVAYVSSKGVCRMPTLKEFNELIGYTYKEDAVVNGVDGIKFISKKNPSRFIFIPAAGIVDGAGENVNKKYAYVWCSEIKLWNIDSDYKLAQRMYFAAGRDASPTTIGSYVRWAGLNVRGVSSKK